MATKRKKKPAAAETNGSDTMSSKTIVAFSLEEHLVTLIDQKISDIQKEIGVNAKISRAAICKGIIENSFSE